MFKRSRKLIILSGDLACLHSALLLTLVSRYAINDLPAHWQNHWLYFLPVFLIWLVIFYINGFYNLNLTNDYKRWSDSLLGAAAASTLATVLYFYLNLKSAIAPRTNLLLFIIFFLTIFYLWRYLYGSLAARFYSPSRISLFCQPDQAERLLKQIADNPGAGYQLGQAISSKEQAASANLALAVQDSRLVVISEKFLPPDRLDQLLGICWQNAISLSDYASFYEQLSGQVAIEELDSSWFLKNIPAGQKKYFDWSKQLADYLLAALIMIVSLPLWLAIAAIIKSSSPGRVFFRQTRLGQNGRPFTIIKFRTMTEGPENKEVTKTGSFLRQTRLDELPQLINILKGEMSFIGPRPEIPEIVRERQAQIPFYRMRLLIKPGLTGWDQISGRYHSSSYEDTVEKLAYDLFYLKQRSPYLDLIIILKTTATIISRNGR